jgi:RimJ/RimL family protein N-acetyltransferase
MTDEEPKQQRLFLVQGQRVGLGALRHDLIPAYLRWRSDPEVMRGTGQSSQVPTVEAIRAWYDQATSPGNREIHFTIYDLDDQAPVGTALLVRVNQHDGTAEFGLTIGERRNQGLGSEATKLVLDWAFTVMGLHNILLVTFSWNLPAIRAYSKAGFREIGRRRGAVLTLGQRYDQVLMDAVADEFSDSVLAKQSPPNAESPGPYLSD